MSRWIVRRTAQMLAVVWGVMTLAFILAFIVPGDPARMVAGTNASPEAVANIRHQLGLDQSLLTQYMHFLGRLLRGDLGVWEILLGIPFGIISAYRPKSFFDRVSTFSALFGLSTPPFWLGLILLYFLAFKLSVFPLNGVGHPLIWYLILPSFTLGVGGAAFYSRIVRTTVINVLQSPFIEFAQLKGMPSGLILRRHVIRHALMPIVTMIGMDLGYFLGGVLIVESIFGIPGIGQLAFRSISTLDVPMITGTVLVASVFMVIMNFIVDVLYTFIDPRVRLQRNN